MVIICHLFMSFRPIVSIMARHFVMISCVLSSAYFGPATLSSQITMRPVNKLMDGKVTVFFNSTVDTTKAIRLKAAGLQNLEQRMVDAINSATRSIDIAAYELTSLNIVLALCKAKERGLQVRIVVDHQASYANNEKLWNQAKRLLSKYNVPYLDDSGYPLIRDKKKRLPEYDADMHDKFVVIDRLSPSPNDDVVWLGSYNFTISGMISAQNLVSIQSADLAGLYTEEFENMWGGPSPVPNIEQAKFHSSKPPISKSTVRLGSTTLDVAFAPMDRQKKKPNFLHQLADLITREAQHDIRICAFAFSAGTEMDEAIREKVEQRGVDVKGVFDRSLGSQKFSIYNDMAGTPSATSPWKGSVEARLSSEDGKLHHKYVLIDAENPDTNDVPIVITGSFNFSKNANLSNDENFVIIRSREVANAFLQEFYARLANARRGTPQDDDSESD